VLQEPQWPNSAALFLLAEVVAKYADGWSGCMPGKNRFESRTNAIQACIDRTDDPTRRAT